MNDRVRSMRIQLVIGFMCVALAYLVTCSTGR